MARNPAGSGGVPAVVDGRPSREELLVERARGGDVHAFEDLVRLHQQIAFRVACVVAGSPADAEEAVQDGFVKAWRALGRFRPGAPFRPWLLAIVVHEARSRRRAASRRRSWAQRAAQDARLTQPGVSDSAESAALAGDRRALLLDAVRALPERDRLAIEMRYLLDLSEHEMAVALGCRPGTVKSRLSRALARLAAQLGEAP